MKTKKALISFSKIRDNELASYAQKIVQKMTDNPNFTAPQPDLATVQNAITLYMAALIKSKDGSKEDTANKVATRLVLENLLGSLGVHVNQVSANDLIKLDSSGFNVSKTPSVIGILDAPTLDVYYGNNSGEMIFEIGADPHATEYVVLYSPSPAPADDAEYYTKIFSKSRGTISNLTSGIKYIFKAAATSSEANKMGIYNFSNPVEKFVP
jgi:hypothetical protein